MREAFRRPLLVVVVAAYLLYCVAGLALKDAFTSHYSTKSALLLMALRAWPYPMLESVGWRAHPESAWSWLIADLAGLVLVAAFSLGVERALGPERRLDPRYMAATLIGAGLSLLLAEFLVVAALKISAAQAS
ncbi:MAG TPA: hypothetical protein VNM14_10715 [Planctomycetota bacterium]|jgi:hypothetical protein|nr:hypothetical protein [Planctomycetota bacterium]